jgi:hypothetical protein
VTINSAPGAPTGVTATAGANAVTVSWRPPAASGGGISGYVVTATAPYHPARQCAGTVTRSPCTVTGLAAGVRYVPRVVAVGTGGGNSAPASGSTTVTPTGTVYAPQSVPAAAVDAGSRVAKPGARLSLTGSGFRGGTRILYALYPGARSLGATTAAASGSVSATVIVPAGLGAGSYTVLATGLDGAGRARYLETAVRVVTGASGVFTVGGRPGVTTARDAVTTSADSDSDSSSSSSSALAVTGTDSGPVMLAGFAMIMTGLLLVVTTRRHWRRRKG